MCSTTQVWWGGMRWWEEGWGTGSGWELSFYAFMGWCLERHQPHHLGHSRRATNVSFQQRLLPLPPQLFHSQNSSPQRAERSVGPVHLAGDRGKLGKMGVYSGTGRVHTHTLRMFVTVGSARRIRPGFGWMLAFSDDFSCGSRSAVLWS